MDEVERFERERRTNIQRLGADEAFARMGVDFVSRTASHKYSYNFTWLGRPIIQFPQDIVALQEILWAVKPELVIETGIAHGGSLLLSASLLELIGNGEVLGIDIDIREHNRTAIEAHPLSHRISMIEGSSTDEAVAAQVREKARGKDGVVVLLDSNHTRDHVLREMSLYAPLVTVESYLVVFDTVVEYMPDDAFPDRPWGPGNSPKTAVDEFLKSHSEFAVDHELEDKLLITVAPGGYLKRMS